MTDAPAILGKMTAEIRRSNGRYVRRPVTLKTGSQTLLGDLGVSGTFRMIYRQNGVKIGEEPFIGQAGSPVVVMLSNPE